jgi:hypothetical protein
VLHDGASFIKGKLLRLLHDISYRFVDFSDVVKQCNTLYAVLHSFVEIRGARERQCILRNSPNVSARLGIVRIDCIEKGLEAGCAESFEGDALTSLVVVEDAGSRTCNE